MKYIKFIVCFCALFGLLSATPSVFAQTTLTTGSSGTTLTSSSTGTTLTTGPSGTGGVTGSSRLLNPLKVDSIEKLLQLILDILLIFAVPIIVFFIIYSGFLFVTAQGNEEQLKKAKNALLWTVIGAVILLGAKVILDVIVNTVTSLQI